MNVEVVTLGAVAFPDLRFGVLLEHQLRIRPHAVNRRVEIHSTRQLTLVDCSDLRIFREAQHRATGDLVLE